MITTTDRKTDRKSVYERVVEKYGEYLQKGASFDDIEENVATLMDVWRETGELGYPIKNLPHARSQAKRIAYQYAGKAVPAHKRHQLKTIDDMLNVNAEELTRKIINGAMNGDSEMIKILADRILPPKIKNNYVDIDLSGTLKEIVERIKSHVGSGEISVQDGKDLMDMVGHATEITDVQEINDKIEAIKNQLPS